jgi:hypothetical protein
MAKLYISATVTYTNLVASDILIGNFVITNNLFDEAGFAEDYFFDFTKSLVDEATTSDALSYNYHKPLSDTFSTGDSFAHSFVKSVTDLIHATDDLDGEASVEDDQNMSFVKKRSDSTFAFDNISVKSITKALADAANIADSGSLRGQSYCDFTYFAEDYVGFSRTF